MESWVNWMDIESPCSHTLAKRVLHFKMNIVHLCCRGSEVLLDYKCGMDLKKTLTFFLFPSIILFSWVFFFRFCIVAPIDSEKGEKRRGKACSVVVIVIFMYFLHAFVIFVVLVCIHLELILLNIFIFILFSCSVYFNDL